jgi:hypothetical protein
MRIKADPDTDKTQYEKRQRREEWACLVAITQANATPRKTSPSNIRIIGM